MKLKRLTGIALTAVLAIALAVSGCKKDDDNGNGNGGTDEPQGPRPDITMRVGPTGTLEWVSSNVTRPPDFDVKFGFYAEYDKPLTSVKCLRRITEGPNSGTETVLLDESLNPADNVLRFPESQFHVIESKSGLAQQVVVFTFIAAADDGTSRSLSIEVRPDIAMGQRQNQRIFDKNEQGSYNIVTGFNIDRNQEKSQQDISIAKTAKSFKITSPNGSKFKHYSGTLLYPGFLESYERIQNAWNQSGAESNESRDIVEDDSYKFILVRSAQNNRVYMINPFDYGDDWVDFDLIGEGL